MIYIYNRKHLKYLNFQYPFAYLPWEYWKASCIPFAYFIMVSDPGQAESQDASNPPYIWRRDHFQSRKKRKRCQMIEGRGKEYFRIVHLRLRTMNVNCNVQCRHVKDTHLCTGMFGCPSMLLPVTHIWKSYCIVTVWNSYYECKQFSYRSWQFNNMCQCPSIIHPYLMFTSGKINLTWQQLYFHFQFHLHKYLNNLFEQSMLWQANMKRWKR